MWGGREREKKDMSSVIHQYSQYLYLNYEAYLEGITRPTAICSGHKYNCTSHKYTELYQTQT